MTGLTLKTDRLLLRPFIKEDAEAVFRMSREETLKSRMPDQVYDSLEEAANVTTFLPDRSEREEWPFVLGVVVKRTGELIGHVGLSQIEEGVEIGYAIAMAHQGNGYAAEAVAAFSYWAVSHFSLKGIWAILMADNVPSQRVLEKSGYKYQWEKKKQAFGGEHPCLCYLYTKETLPCN